MSYSIWDKTPIRVIEVAVAALPIAGIHEYRETVREYSGGATARTPFERAGLTSSL